jgi:hypothetical protein
VAARQKAVALKCQKNGEVIAWNPVFAAVALDLGSGSKSAHRVRGLFVNLQSARFRVPRLDPPALLLAPAVLVAAGIAIAIRRYS